MPPPLPERYQLEVRLGRDGDIEEWLATDVHLDRPVMVRLLGPEVDADRRSGFLAAVGQAAFQLLGSGFGPTVAGIFATRVVGEDSLGLALLLCLAIFVPLSALICYLALKDPSPGPIDPDDVRGDDGQAVFQVPARA